MKGDYRDLVLPPGAKVLQIPAELGGPAEPATAVAARPRPRRQARYTRPEKGKRNKLEARYEAYLGTLKAAGEIHDFAFEPEKFRLANEGDACYFTPDFRVLLNDGTVEFHDTKGGFIEEDANIKMKWFVQQHPYPIVVVQWIKGEWCYDRREP